MKWFIYLDVIPFCFKFPKPRNRVRIIALRGSTSCLNCIERGSGGGTLAERKDRLRRRLDSLHPRTQELSIGKRATSEKIGLPVELPMPSFQRNELLGDLLPVISIVYVTNQNRSSNGTLESRSFGQACAVRNEDSRYKNDSSRNDSNQLLSLIISL